MNPLANSILRGEVQEGQVVRVSFEGSEFVFRGESAQVQN